MPKRYFADLAEGQTRDCLDPWSFTLIEADGAVRPCCWHEQVGHLSQDSLENILDGEAIQELRARVLTGELDPECAGCPSRGVTDTQTLREKVFDFLTDETSAARIINLCEYSALETANITGEGKFVVEAHRIFLHPNAPEKPPPWVGFNDLEYQNPAQFHSQILLNNDRANPVWFRASLVAGESEIEPASHAWAYICEPQIIRQIL